MWRKASRQVAATATTAAEADHRKAWAAHLGLLSLADDIFGKLLDDLDALGLADDTLVVFTSDHGHHLGQHNMFGINELYEQTVHVPFIVSDRTRGFMMHHHFNALAPGILTDFNDVEVGVGGQKIKNIFLGFAEPVLPSDIPPLHQYRIKTMFSASRKKLWRWG